MGGEPRGRRTAFDRGARLYDVLPVPTHPEALRHALDGAPGPLVDLGGGTAKHTVRFATAPDAIVADPSRPMMQQARRKGRPVRLVQAVGHHLPFQDGSIGTITATEAFHHFAPDQDATLAECARVLRPDGVLVIEEPDPARVLGRLMQLAERVARLGSSFHTAEALATRVRRRFGDVTITRSGSFTYLLTARLPTAWTPTAHAPTAHPPQPL